MSVAAHLSAVVQNAHTLAAEGDLRGAAAMLDQALDVGIPMLGVDNPEILAASRVLASFYRELGELSEARRLLEESLAAGHYTLGDEHPLLLSMSYDLGTLANELGNRHEARRNFTRVASLGPAALGAGHEYVRAAAAYLGTAPQQSTSTTVPPIQPPAPRPIPAPAPPVEPPPRPALPVEPPPRPALPGPPPRGAEVEPARVGWPQRHDSEPYAPPDHDDHDGRRHSRAPLIALALVALMALVGGAIAAAVVFRTAGTPRGPAASAALAPPGDLRLRDEGDRVTLTWTDPSGGAAPFLVTGGRADGPPGALATTRSGETTYTVNGLSETADYCFIVVVVYSGQHAIPSDLVCTQRGKTPRSPGSSRTR